MRSTIIIVLCSGFSVFHANQVHAQSEGLGRSDLRMAEGANARVIVKFRPGTSAVERRAVHQSYGHQARG